MSSDAVREIFLLIEQLETTIKKQNKLIAKLINENVEQENFINALLRENIET